MIAGVSQVKCDFVVFLYVPVPECFRNRFFDVHYNFRGSSGVSRKRIILVANNVGDLGGIEQFLIYFPDPGVVGQEHGEFVVSAIPFLNSRFVRQEREKLLYSSCVQLSNLLVVVYLYFHLSGMAFGRASYL